MTVYHIKGPSRLKADVKLPASKSISNRALIICALAGGHPLPTNLSDCDDTEVIVHALHNMPHVIDIKAAGTAMRFMTAFLAVTNHGQHLLTGTERMMHRPIGVLVDALRHLGADITYERAEGFPPLSITGTHIEGGELEIDGHISSQYISALLMIGPMLKHGLTLRLRGPIVSRPYIDLTLYVMREYGAEVDWASVDTIVVKPTPYVSRPFLIENDWSAASYWYEMVALSSDPEAEVHLDGLMDGSKQGDSSVRYIFSLLGVSTLFTSSSTVLLRKTGRHVPRMEYDFSNSPDLAQTIVVSCCALGIPFHLTGLQTLKIKETDRMVALCTELRKFGYVVTQKADSELLWSGERCMSSHEPVDTYDDHRMALAFAPLSLQKSIVIREPHVVTKSYPSYWDDLRRVGFYIAE